MLENDVFIQSLIHYRAYLQTLGYNDETVKNKVFYLKHFLVWIEEKTITQTHSIKPKDIKNYHIYLKQKRNLRTAEKLSEDNTNHQIRNLQQYFDWLVDKKAIDSNPASGISLKKPKDRAERFVFSQADIQALYKQAENLEETCLLHLAYGCGLRVGELVKLNVEDIDLEKGLLTVVKGKNNKRRVIPITTKIIKDIQAYLLEREDLFTQNRLCLFLNIEGNRMQANSFRIRLKKLIDKTPFGRNLTSVEKQKIGIHTLRHSIASHFLENGMAMEQIQKFLGHQHLDTTETYTHVSKESLQALNTEDYFI